MNKRVSIIITLIIIMAISFVFAWAQNSSLIENRKQISMYIGDTKIAGVSVDADIIEDQRIVMEESIYTLPSLSKEYSYDVNLDKTAMMEVKHDYARFWKTPFGDLDISSLPAEMRKKHGLHGLVGQCLTMGLQNRFIVLEVRQEILLLMRLMVLPTSGSTNYLPIQTVMDWSMKTT